MGLGGGLPKTLGTTFILFSSLATILVGISGQDVPSCTSNSLLPAPVSALGITVEHCTQLGVEGSGFYYDFLYKLDNSTSPSTLSVILIVPRVSQRWYGMGFNPENQMIGTSAIVFWLNPTTSKIEGGPYYLSETAPTGVKPDSTTLTFKKTPQFVVDTNYIYLAYEVEEINPTNFANQHFVMGQPSNVPSGTVITTDILQHAGQTSLQTNFLTGTTLVTTVNVDGRARTHGILNIIGWGVLLPIGVIVARYARGFDPHWFYFHAVCQVVGYGFVLAGLITGIKLLDLLPGLDASDHKALGIFLFVLATLQISAVLIRPKREAKLRRYWNWGHWWLGRVALVIAAANIFVGIHLANASSKWRVGYGVVLGLELFVVVVLEILLWVNYSRSKNESHLPQTAMQNRGSNVASAPPPPYETNWDGKP